MFFTEEGVFNKNVRCEWEFSLR